MDPELLEAQSWALPTGLSLTSQGSPLVPFRRIGPSSTLPLPGPSLASPFPELGSPAEGERFPCRRGFSNWERKPGVGHGCRDAGAHRPPFLAQEATPQRSVGCLAGAAARGEEGYKRERHHDSACGRSSRRSARWGSGPALSSSPSSLTARLLTWGPARSRAPGCSPQISALLQRGHPASCLRAPGRHLPPALASPPRQLGWM